MDTSGTLISRVFRGKMLHWIQRHAPFISIFLRKRRLFSALILLFCIFPCILFVQKLDGSPYDLAYSQLDRLRTGSLHSPSNIDAAYDLRQLYKTLHFDTGFEYPTGYELQKDLLTIHYGPQRGQKVESVDDLQFYDSDPRLLWSVLASHLTSEATTSTPLPFSWYDWADFHDYNKLIAVRQCLQSCSFFFGHHFNSSLLLEIERETGEQLFAIDRGYYSTQDDPELSELEITEMIQRENSSCVTDISFYADSEQSRSSHAFSVGFVVKSLQDQVRPEVYRLQARNHLLHALKIPLSLTILNGDRGAWQVPIRQDNRQNMVQSGLLQKYLKSALKGSDKPLELDFVSEFDRFSKSEASKFLTLKTLDLHEEKDKAFKGLFTHLEKEDFEFDAIAKIEELSSRSRSLSAHESSYLDSLIFSTQTHFAFAPKYFHEPGGLKDFLQLGRHHDSRFFNGAIFRDPKETLLRLNSMVITFQKFLKANSLTCWLAHGSLFGYLYNGLNFPWDNDFDVQMPIRHLHILALNFNQSLVVEDPREGNGRFLMDVGSSITHRTQGNGNNNIDARFIDIDSGLYIDITALSVSSAMLSNHDAVLFQQNKDSIGTEIKHSDPNLIANITDIPLQVLYNKIQNDTTRSDEERRQVQELAEKFNKDFPSNQSPTKFFSAEQRYNLNHELGLYNCRNHHFVQFDSVSQLIATKFHGVSALVPSKYITLLKREYRVPMKFRAVTFQTRSFVQGIRSWVQSSLLKKLMNITGRRENLEDVKSPANNLKSGDVDIILRNSARSNSVDFLSYVHNSKEISTYRRKEIELQFSETYSSEEKISMLQQLDASIGTRLKPVMEDPRINSLRKKMWHTLSGDAQLTPEILMDLNLEIAEETIAWNSLLDGRALPFLIGVQEEEEAAGGNHDLNLKDLAIDLSNVFARDPNF
ncbi:LAFA_0E03400g1_1 [Lachancea sp. 'fantastica']|nr:LAFA_0E03400g1_1 [Lachancea sp. 'fantastica']